jgi:hypothetical protein
MKRKTLRYVVHIPIAEKERFEQFVQEVTREKRCARCGQPFHFRRNSQRFCSGTCRMAYYAGANRKAEKPE